MKLPDLDPGGDSADLVDALWALRRSNDKSRHEEVAVLAQRGDDIVREEALSLLLTQWRDSRYRHLAIEALESDPDPGVRGLAALGLGAAMTDRTREEDVAMLKRTLFDNKEDPNVRRSCYEALCILAEKAVPVVNAPFDPGRDVDAEWVRQL